MPQGANFPQAPPMTMDRRPTLVTPVSISFYSLLTWSHSRGLASVLRPVSGIDVHSNPAELLAKSRRLRSFPEFQGANTNLAFHQPKSSSPPPS